MKPSQTFDIDKKLREMPPTRGHDLKPVFLHYSYLWCAMPPTRGHDLKHLMTLVGMVFTIRCPPHGGTT